MSTYSESQRVRYLRHEITFEDYYGLLVDLLGEEWLRTILPVQHSPEEWRELIAKDEHLNNVPLHQWDACDYLVRARAFRANRDALTAINGTGGWSLADSVIVLKATARRYAGETK